MARGRRGKEMIKRIEEVKGMKERRKRRRIIGSNLSQIPAFAMC